jgi:putative MATE family efflux protein
VIFGLAFMIVSLIFLDPILRFFGASSATLPYAHDYMVVILLGNVFTHIYLGLNGILRSSGMPQKAMYATLISVVLNAVLTPIFIFTFKWGIKGSALATVISQIIMLGWQIKLFSNKDHFIHLQKGIFKPDPKIIKDSLAIGMSPFLMNAVSCVIVIIINQTLIRHGGDLAVGAYGIVNRISFLFIMVTMGLNQGMQPIAGYNFGARNYKRVNEVLKLTILMAIGVMTFGFLIVELFPELVASVFTKDSTLIHLAAEGLRIVFLFFPIVGFQMVVTNFFQSIGMAGRAVFLSLSRQLHFFVCVFIVFNFCFLFKMRVVQYACGRFAGIVGGCLYAVCEFSEIY